MSRFAKQIKHCVVVAAMATATTMAAAAAQRAVNQQRRDETNIIFFPCRNDLIFSWNIYDRLIFGVCAANVEWQIVETVVIENELYRLLNRNNYGDLVGK